MAIQRIRVKFRVIAAEVSFKAFTIACCADPSFGMRDFGIEMLIAPIARLKNPNTTVTSSQFMRITSAYDPRILRVAARVSW